MITVLRPQLRDEPLVGVVTTDLAGIARGRFVAAKRLEQIAGSGVGWLQADLSLTAFSSIATPNPWGSRGDVRILPDLTARYRTTRTGSETPFDMVFGNVVELDGAPWSCCTRALLRQALSDLESVTGWSVIASFEQEFQLFGSSLPREHAMSFAALRQTDPFAPRLVASLEEAGIEPEVVLAEYGQEQFEVTCTPSDAVTAADRSVAIREITREVARNSGCRASFAPKTAPNAVGNGVHIHFSFRDERGQPAGYEPERPGGLSTAAGAFAAGILRHLPALTAFTAPSVPSYYRLKPHTWSSSYTWLGLQDREATLRICPPVPLGKGEAAAQQNLEYRAADAVANPYLSLAALVRAGLAGLEGNLPAPPLVSDDPTQMSAADRERLGLVRLPETLDKALAALSADATVTGWFDPRFIETFVGVRRAEIARLSDVEPEDVCAMYRELY